MLPGTLLVWAAALVFALGLAHSVLGERYILIRLFRRADLPQMFGSDVFTKRTLRFAWHLTTVVWWGIAWLLWRMSGSALTVPEVATTIVWVSALSGLIALFASRGQHLSWLAFFAIALLVHYGTPALRLA
jgi:hypothetical protein